ncbi:hemerythrin domain-containing protein [Burkholderia oklahomensis]|uniref:hemerythrin domain-containing protein n=1 Tax=Burkholderia oklahomensis TaxID=342113 RepID=UPI0026516B8B|nr:hemerythrin domain-containing protein [Burkholderia oklahomensis]MDN7673118.1 hemerythrin domain-containing protein [Burkholderia oklahomensis]
MYRHFFVPVDDTDAGIDTVAYAVEFARSIGARITFVQARLDAVREVRGAREAATPPPDAVARPSREGGRASEWPIAKAEAAARARGVPCDSARVTGATTAGALADAMLERDCDLLCIAPAPADVDLSSTRALAADRLAAQGIAVLTCAFRRSPATARVIAALYDDHRAVTGALDAWLAQLRAAIEGGRALDAADARAIANGLSNLRNRRHPKEERWFYPVLRGVTGAVDAELGELERQHRRNARMLFALLDAIEADIACDAPPTRFEQALSAYAQCVCEHIGRHEGVIVPAAQRYLSDDDWRAIDVSIATAAPPIDRIATHPHPERTLMRTDTNEQRADGSST